MMGGDRLKITTVSGDFTSTVNIDAKLIKLHETCMSDKVQQKHFCLEKIKSDQCLKLANRFSGLKQQSLKIDWAFCLHISQ